jgi:hypothetical protein
VSFIIYGKVNGNVKEKMHRKGKKAIANGCSIKN